MESVMDHFRKELNKALDKIEKLESEIKKWKELWEDIKKYGLRKCDRCDRFRNGAYAQVVMEDGRCLCMQCSNAEDYKVGPPIRKITCGVCLNTMETNELKFYDKISPIYLPTLRKDQDLCQKCYENIITEL